MINQSKDTLKEGIDYTISQQGLLVFTKHYLQKRAFCCDNGCKNCPYSKLKNSYNK